MQDITAPLDGVDIQVRSDGRVVWINVDGACVLRISHIPDLVLLDDRPKEGDEQ